MYLFIFSTVFFLFYKQSSFLKVLLGFPLNCYFYTFFLRKVMVKNSNRLVSLDIFRGLTVAFMIIVNTPGSWSYVYPPLRHATWHGCTPTDLVFPFFLFIAGVSMWYSFLKYGHEINGGSVLRIFRRVVTIFAIGLFLAIFPYFGRDYSTLRIMGVLQRIALAYGIGAFICLTIKREFLWIVIVVLLLLYWALLVFLGGAEPFSLEGNIAPKVDTAILGVKHLYKGFGIPFDPEGLFSTLSAVVTVILGYYIGDLIGKGSASGKTVLKLLLFGTASVGLGLLWSIVFPINKPLWTSSYVLYSAGLGMGVLAVIYLIADVIKFQVWGSFFIIFGTNALFSYFLAGIWTRIMLFIKISSGNNKISLYTYFYDKICVPVAGNMNGSLMFALIQVLIIWLLALILYRKKILIRL
jgi:predicted acyltransferase